MAKPTYVLHIFLALGLLGTFLLTACDVKTETSSTQGEAEHEEAESEEAEHDAEEAEHGDTHGPEEHIAGEAHDVPEEAATVPNPVEADDLSVQAGTALYAANCAICHGETGEGDGPTAESLETRPSDLHAGHVQELSDGALFYIISHGKPETPMPAWENVLSEEERWHVVNYLRTFSE